MNFSTRFRAFSLLFLAIITLSYSCTKIDSTTIGSGLIPPIDGVNTKDTVFDISSDMVKNDLDTFYAYKTDVHALGVVTNDPLFGTTDAQINAQIKPEYYPVYFEKRRDSLVLDSIVLALAWYNTWGDTMTKVNLQVREIAQSADFRFDSSYTNYAEFQTTGGILGSVDVDPRTIRKVDTLKTYREAVYNQVRIRLDNQLGIKFLNDFDSIKSSTSPQGAYANDSAFKTHFKGFNIRATSGNSLLNIILADTNTKVALYYKVRQPDNSLKDSFVRYFRFNTTTSASSNYVRRLTTSSYITQAISPASNNDSLLYMRSNPGGHKADLRISGITAMRNVIVHRAELLLDQVQPFPAFSNFDNYFSPPNLFLAAYSADSSRLFAIPYDVELSTQGVTNLSIFGGFPVRQYNGGVFSHYAYNFNITRYIQNIVTTKSNNYKLVLFAPYFGTMYAAEKSTYTIPISSSPFNYPGIGRVLIAGGNYKSDPSKRARLRIIYSEL